MPERSQHLSDAEAYGRSVEEVVGDRVHFAESWAAAYQGKAAATWNDVQSGKTKKQRDFRRDKILLRIGTAAVIIAAVVSEKGR
ncbi:MAG: hypothetical protein ACC658_15920 [Acidimicrobiia bacterium]